MKTAKFIKAANYDYKSSRAEENSGELKTLPDESLSVRDILINHTRGIQVGFKPKQSAYNGEIFIPDVRKMDLVDQEEYLQKTKNEYNEKLATESKRQNAAREAETLARLQEEARKPKLDV